MYPKKLQFAAYGQFVLVLCYSYMGKFCIIVWWRGNGKSSNREKQIFLGALKMLCLYSLDKLFAGLRQVAAHIELSTWPKTVTMRLKLPNHLKSRVLGRHHQNCRPSFNIKKIVENIQCYTYDTYANLSCFLMELNGF